MSFTEVIFQAFVVLEHGWTARELAQDGQVSVSQVGVMSHAFFRDRLSTK